MNNIPNLDALYEEVCTYVKEHQGEKGYIDCQPYQEEPGDIIYTFEYNEDSGWGEERMVYGVRWNEEEEDLEMQRPEMEYEMFNAVRKNNDNPVKLIAVTSDDGEKLYISLGYNDSREFGVFTDEEAFVPFDELSDDEVYSVYVSLTRW